MNLLTPHLESVPDPRGHCNARRHNLLDLLTIALCALLSGAETFVDMESFGNDKHAWLVERLGLELACGIPSHDTFGRLFAALDATAWGAAVQAWSQQLQVLTGGQVLALDGKCLRRSFDTATGKGALHLVSAWASASRLILAQVAVDSKSNEITAVPTLLELLEVRGCIVTVDALNSQKAIAQVIIDKEGDYVFALKDNHRRLHAEVADFFEWCRRQPGGLNRLVSSHSTTREAGHGRYEVRRVWCLDATDGAWEQARAQWPGLQSLVLVERERAQSVVAAGAAPCWSAPSVERHYYLSSLPCLTSAQARGILEAVRGHWGIENQVHWVLDVVFDEDRCRVRKDQAPHNLAILRHLALNLLRHTPAKIGLQARRLRAAWNNDFLLQVLLGAPKS